MSEAGCLKDGMFQNVFIQSGKIDSPSTKPLSFGGLETTFATVERTAAPADGQALAKNTHYILAGGANRSLTLPLKATSEKGDFITLTLTGNMNNAAVLKIGTSGEYFTAGSKLFVEGQDSTRVSVIDFADGTGDDFLNIKGTTNGDGGIGTTIDLFFNGSSWSVNARVTGQGTMAAASDANTKFHTA